jgi:hypothetical protein
MKDILNYLQDMYNPELDFYYGLAFSAFLLLLVRFIAWIISCRKCKGIMLNGEKGNLFITTTAIEDFVIRTLANLEDTVIDKVRLRKLRGGYSIVIFMRALGECNVTEVRPIIEKRVMDKTKQKLGIDSIEAVNIILKNFSAKERQIKGRHKLAMKELENDSDSEFGESPVILEQTHSD